MEQEIFYRREYSDLPDLQRGRNVWYSLMRAMATGSPVYGVRITEQGADGVEYGDYFPLTVSREAAQRVLTYLYENGVSASHCQGVVSDLAATLDGSECHGEALYQALDCG